MLALSACSSTPPGPDPSPSPVGTVTRADADARFLAARTGSDFRQAANLYGELLERARPSERPELLAQIGKCRMGSGEYEGAVQAFTDILEESVPAELRVEAYYRRGLAYNALWKPESALADLRKVQQAPAETRGRAIPEPEFLLRLGVTLMRTGLWSEGRHGLEQLLKSHPKSDEAGQARDRAAMTSFRVQIGAVQDDATAARRVAEAAAKGLRAESVASAEGGRRLILTGSFKRFDDAVREMERLRGLGFADAFPVP